MSITPSTILADFQDNVLAQKAAILFLSANVIAASTLFALNNNTQTLTQSNTDCMLMAQHNGTTILVDAPAKPKTENFITLRY